MSKTYSAIMTGDVIYTIDVDEFLRPSEIVKLSEEIIKKNMAGAITSHYVFFGDFNTVITNPNTDLWFKPCRLFKRNPKALISHIPIGLIIDEKRYPPAPLLNADDYNIFTHHYSYVDIRAALDKYKYYRHRGWGRPPDKRLRIGLERFEKNRKELINSKYILRKKKFIHYLKEYRGNYLPIVEKIKKDLEDLNKMRDGLEQN